MARLSQDFYLLAAALSVLGVLAHAWLWAPQMLGPLDATGLSPEVVWMRHFSWHVDTVAVMAMVVMFFLAARRHEDAAFWTTPAPYGWGQLPLLERWA